MQEVVGGTTRDLFASFELALNNLKDSSAIPLHAILLNLKGSVTDSHVTNNCVMDLFEEMRTKTCELAHDEPKLVRMSCGLHLIVNLTTATEDALRIFEKMIGANRSGAAELPMFYSSKSESGNMFV